MYVNFNIYIRIYMCTCLCAHVCAHVRAYVRLNQQTYIRHRSHRFTEEQTLTVQDGFKSESATKWCRKK